MDAPLPRAAGFAALLAAPALIALAAIGFSNADASAPTPPSISSPPAISAR